MDELQQQEFLEHKLKLFTDRMRSVISNTIGEVEAEYLPFLETDTYKNVQSIANGLIEDYLADKVTTPFVYDFMTPAYSKAVREKIFEENKEEIAFLLVKEAKEDAKIWKEITESKRNY